jgi:hypothetical protein
MPFVILAAFLFSLIRINAVAQTFSTQSSATFPAPLGPGRVTVGDFDNDDDGDMLYQTGADGTAFKFARSNGDGTFTDQAISSSPFAGVTLVNHNGSNYHVADFDRDGDQDIWAGVNATTGSYYRNDGGVFTTQSSATFPNPAVSSRAVAGDFDKDGDADFLYQSGGAATAFKYARSNGNGTFTDVPFASSPFGGLGTLVDNNGFNYHVADFDGDGDVDVWAGVNNSSGSYYRNDNGTFTNQSSATFPAPLGSGRVAVSDYDTDGDADILYQTGGNGTAFQYARSEGNGTFIIMSQALSPFASVTLADHTGFNYYIEDFDNDDDMDVWAAGASTTGSFYSKDDAPPYLVAFTPVNNATAVSPSVNITYTFSESVVKGIGNIYIVRTSDNTNAEVIAVGSSQVTGSGTDWTINPSITLAASTQYAIKSDAGTFKNASGTIFGGVSLSNVQNFTTAMTLNSVSVPAAGTYKGGDNLNFSVTFSESVVVNTAGGIPSIALAVGSATKYATYVSGSGTTVLTFRYTVASGDFDNDGITVGSAIVLNGGTIKNSSANADAPLPLNNVGSTSGVLVAAIEVCDGVDNDGDGSVDEGFDADGDGYSACQNDCDDSDPDINPNTEWFLDGDNDGYYTGSAVTQCASPGAGYKRTTGLTGGNDCDDGDGLVHTTYSFYTDGDADGYGTGSAVPVCAVNAATPPAGYAVTGGDCDDMNKDVHAAFSFYVDSDGDGDGAGSLVSVCAENATTAPSGYSLTGADCDDDNGLVWQSATLYIDGDGDGYDNGSTTVCYGAAIPSGYRETSAGRDCDDQDEAVNAQYQFYEDMDGDTYGSGSLVSVCAVDATTPPTGYSANNTDCAPTDGTSWRSASLYVDSDGDGYDNGTQALCYGSSVPTGYKETTSGSDCDDADATAHAMQQYYVDSDQDGFGSTTTVMLCAATAPTGYATNNTDCNDADRTVHARQQYYVDNDHDGYGSTATALVCATTPPVGYSTNNTDCNDGDPAVYANCGPCKNASGFSTTNITTTSAKLNWVATAHPAQWQVQYKSTAPGAKWIDVAGVTPSMRSVTISGLKPKQAYMWHIRAKCGTKWTSYSGSVSFKTLATSVTATYPNELTVREEAAGQDLHVRALPNPSTTYFTLILRSNSDKAVSLRMVDAVGRTVEGKSGLASNTTLKVGHSYRPGVYFAQVLQGGKMVTLKLIKQAY